MTEFFAKFHVSSNCFNIRNPFPNQLPGSTAKMLLYNTQASPASTLCHIQGQNTQRMFKILCLGISDPLK